MIVNIEEDRFRNTVYKLIYLFIDSFISFKGVNNGMFIS